MDLQTLCETVKEIGKHVAVINDELGQAQVDIAWLKASWWALMDWMKVLSVGIFISVIGTITNIVITKRNGKR